MYGFPKDLDLGDILGSEIIQICLGRYDIQFVFTEDRKISVESLVELFQGEKLISRWTPKDNWSSVTFQLLFHASVNSYFVLNERLLQIRFQNGLRMHLHDTEQFESVHFFPEGIIV